MMIVMLSNRSSIATWVLQRTASLIPVEKNVANRNSRALVNCDFTFMQKLPFCKRSRLA
jgi:hypothetical protein